jgi:hypothetical protein
VFRFQVTSLSNEEGKKRAARAVAIGAAEVIDNRERQEIAARTNAAREYVAGGDGMLDAGDAKAVGLSRRLPCRIGLLARLRLDAYVLNRGFE